MVNHTRFAPLCLIGLLLWLLLFSPLTWAQCSAAAGPDAAAECVRQQTGGRVLSIKPIPGQGGFHIKILLANGRVRTVAVQ